jgi:hypothetical protein
VSCLRRCCMRRRHSNLCLKQERHFQAFWLSAKVVSDHELISILKGLNMSVTRRLFLRSAPIASVAGVTDVGLARGGYQTPSFARFSIITKYRVPGFRQLGTRLRCTQRPELQPTNPLRSSCSKGVGLDVLGIGYQELPKDVRTKVVAEYLRIDFDQSIAEAFLDGFKHKTQTTEATCNEDICSHFIRNSKRSNFYDQIQTSPFQNS